MKKLIIVGICALFTLNISAQNFQRKKRIGKESPTLEIAASKAFQTYVSDAKAEINKIENNILDMKLTLPGKNLSVRKYITKHVRTLQIENNELKSDLNDFINYGIGNWKLFKIEFNESIALVQNDLKQLGVKFLNEDLIGLNEK